jgi:hypothetical protein
MRDTVPTQSTETIVVVSFARAAIDQARAILRIRSYQRLRPLDPDQRSDRQLPRSAHRAMDVYLSTVSNRINAVMKQLTIIATIFLPLMFVTGFFGQNFGWMVSHSTAGRFSLASASAARSSPCSHCSHSSGTATGSKKGDAIACGSSCPLELRGVPRTDAVSWCANQANMGARAHGSAHRRPRS